MKGIKTAFAIVLFTSGTSHVMATGPDMSGRSGEIYFAGAMKESTCRFSTLPVLGGACYRNGVTRKESITQPGQSLFNNIVETRIDWLNPKKTLGVVIVNYR